MSLARELFLQSRLTFRENGPVAFWSFNKVLKNISNWDNGHGPSFAATKNAAQPNT